MNKSLLIVAASILLATPALSNPSRSDWPRWRGPNDNGLVDAGNPPVEWSEDKNVKWKVAIPGLGHATPIVLGETIYVQTAEVVEEGGLLSDATYHFKLVALNRNTGAILWQKTVRQGPPAESKHHRTASFASSSGISDGEHLYAYFGSQGLYCYDLEGNLKWQRDLGDMQTRNSFGEGSSPTIHGNTMLVNWDHEGASFIVALDKRDGKELWRKSRDEVSTWVTPLVVQHNGGYQAIVSASSKTRSYDLETGKVLWELSGLGSNVIPMPLHKDGIVYVSSGHRSPAMQAVSLDRASGDITGTDAVLWSITQNTPYVSSPLLYGDRLYMMKGRNGILSCYNAKTGEVIYGPERLGMGHVYASLVGVNDRIYISDLDGSTLVIKDSPTFEVLAKNTLDEGMSASPVVVGDDLYLRGYNHLYCIAAD